MSLIGGIHHFDNMPVDSDVIINFGVSLDSNDPDEVRDVRTASVRMVYRPFHTTRESHLETQPFVSSEGHVLAWDGRLDNRRELLALLHNELNTDHTDVAIVMAAYLKLGIEFLPRLIGDFAISLWDAKRRTLLLARDAIGPRPLYYHADSDRVIWSSELKPLLDASRTTLEVNDEYVAGYITRGPDPKLTPYKNIFSVPPGEVAIIRNGQLRVQRFWALNPNYEIRYKTDAQYEEHFYQLFRESVRSRLRVQGPVWAMLSGGLDSSAIVCMADDILQSGEGEASKLETVSFVYDASRSSDERNYISSVEDKRRRQGLHLRDEDYPPLASFPELNQLDFPDFLDCFPDLHTGLCAAMRSDGARVLLTGHGGDEMLGSNPSPSPEIGDLLVQWRFLGLHHSLRKWSAALNRPYLELLWRDGIMSVLPAKIQLSCRAKPYASLPPWFDTNFVKRMNLEERNLGPKDVFGFSLPSERDQVVGFLSILRMTSKAAYRARGGIEASHPYLHRPLIEFLQAIPFQQRVQPGETRVLMRRALRNLLPDKVLKRKGKKGPDEALFRALARQWPRLRPIFENARVCSNGYMNPQALLKALERARHGCEPYSFAIIQTLSLECWLRALERRNSIATNPLISMLEGPKVQQTTWIPNSQPAKEIRVHQGTP
ncbi:MAG TPA: asparagine synthase-related protein [Pyrinomonadaceae bacterium]|nr:asparagine synthase-related protein [Pyrinomonadaceae bacterium]